MLSVSRTTVRKVIPRPGDRVQVRARRAADAEAGRMGRHYQASYWRRIEAATAGTALDFQRLFEELRGRGYDGAHDTVPQFIDGVARRTGAGSSPGIRSHELLLPGKLSSSTGAARQSHSRVLAVDAQGGCNRLSHGHMPFVRAFRRETQELVFDAHDKAFQFYGGVCRRGIYEPTWKTAVEAIFVGKARRYSAAFCGMCSHHLIEPVACTPRSVGLGEKGQVENQVGNPARRVLPAEAAREEPCRTVCLSATVSASPMRNATQHPEFEDRTIWEVFRDERSRA